MRLILGNFVVLFVADVAVKRRRDRLDLLLYRFGPLQFSLFAVCSRC